MRTGGRATASGSWLGGVAVGITLAIILGAGVPLFSIGTTGLGRPTGGAQGAAPTAGGSVRAAALEAAQTSLINGGGPASGAPWRCLSTGGGASCSGAVGAAPRPTTAHTLPNWSQASFTPSARTVPGGTTMTYDAADGYVLLFGGSTLAGPLSDTWTFANGLWTHLHPKTAPSPRYGSALTYDAGAGYVLLFGGFDGTTTAFNDTWSFLKGQWAHLAPTTVPPQLVEPAAVYDANDSYVVLFGGNIGPAFTALSHTTYTFSAGNWHKLPTPTSPPGREDAAMAYDAADGWVVLFGGLNGTRGVIGDTWNFSAGHWTNRTSTASVAPSARYFSAMAYDATDKVALLFGGRTGGFAVLGDTWSFARGAWSKVTPAFAPSARSSEALAASSTTGGVTLFGGGPSSGGLASDTWTYAGGVWKHVIPPAPAPRVGASATYDEADGYVLLFGGEDNGRGYADTWTFNAGTWHHLHPAVAPPARIAASMAYDAADGYVVLYGGQDPHTGNFLNDTWTFQGGVWRGLPLPDPSSGLTLAGAIFTSMAYDASDGYLLMFGGDNISLNGSSVDLGTTYEFSDGNWTVAGTLVAPPARDAAAMAYDSWDGEIVLFGGQNISGLTTVTYRDTWVWSGGSWSELKTKATPVARAAAMMVYDGNDGYVLLFGGLNESGATIVFNDTWSFVGGVWTKLGPSTSPPPLYLAAVAFNAKGSDVVLVGGTGTANPPPIVLNPITWIY